MLKYSVEISHASPIDGIDFEQQTPGPDPAEIRENE
jgi:hypothetical protein